MEQKQQDSWDIRTLQLCSWIVSRVSGVDLLLPKYNLPLLDSTETISNVDGGWQKVNSSLFE